jgi:hypothetical protein
MAARVASRNVDRWDPVPSGPGRSEKAPTAWLLSSSVVGQMTRRRSSKDAIDVALRNTRAHLLPSVLGGPYGLEPSANERSVERSIPEVPATEPGLAAAFRDCCAIPNVSIAAPDSAFHGSDSHSRNSGGHGSQVQSIGELQGQRSVPFQLLLSIVKLLRSSIASARM